jgi:pSer/pThr/pTyr-binding forkhead associated (FHA) protein
MKLSLVVTSPGKGEGKTIPVTLSQFLIGRDPQCQLRPASPVISKRHCAVLVKGGKAFVRDFDSTNGTFVNDQPVKGEVELHNGDRLKVGPLAFLVKMETTTPVNKPTPAPPPADADASHDDESIAAMLLCLQDEGDAKPAGTLGPDGIPEGSTVMDVPAPLEPGAQLGPEAGKPEEKKGQAKPATGNTASAAKAILEKYTRRQRT